MAYRPVDPLRLFTDSLGAPLAGGMVEFLETGTTDAKSVYSDEALSVNLGNTVTLDAAGFLPSDVWGSGTYRVRVYDADSVLVDEADPITDPAGADTSLPSMSGHSGEFLTNNGSIASWTSIRQTPDPTGHTDKYLKSDGTAWVPATLTVPDLPAEGVADETNGITVGKTRLLTGDDTAPASGTHLTSKAVSFGVTFSVPPKVFVTAKETQIAPTGFNGVVAVKSITTTGCTVHFDINEADIVSGNNIDTAVPFDWMAIGKLP